MKLSELFTNLSHGEFAGLMIGSEGAGYIEDCHQPRLVTAIDQSLGTMTGRFLVIENELRVGVRNATTVYPLEKKFAHQDATVVEFKYIEDTVHRPFQGDVIKILEVFNEGNERMVLNDPLDPASLFTIGPKTLQVPYPVDGNSYYVTYQARHPRIVIGENNVVDVDQEILIPDLLIPALQRHVAWKVFSAMNGQDHIARAQEHLATYELICSEIETNDLVSTSRTIVLEKFEERGWD